MERSVLPADGGRAANLILVALVRKLMEKGVLADGDVHALLHDAARGFDAVAGEPLSAEAAQALADSELVPAFLGR